MKEAMKGISLMMSKKHYDIMTKLKYQHFYPSISAIIRDALRIALPEILKSTTEVKDFIDNNDITNVLKYVKEHGYIIYNAKQPRKHIPLGNIYYNSHNEVIQ